MIIIEQTHLNRLKERVNHNDHDDLINRKRDLNIFRRKTSIKKSKQIKHRDLL